MTRFEQKTHPGVYAATALTIAAVFAADWAAPLGVTVWIFYLLPVTLCLRTSRPDLPLYVAGVCIAAVIIDYFISPDGLPISEDIVQLNRLFGVVVLGGVGLMSRQIIRSRVVLQRDAWLRSGQNGLSAHVQGDLGMEALGGRLLEFLSRYLEAEVAVMYAAEEGRLRRIAGFALDASRHPAETYRIGEGLTGQAAVSGRALRVKDLPDDYIRVSSGLGERKPRELLVAPVAASGQVEGVLEFGFFHRVHDSDLELLDMVSERVAIALQAARDRTQLENLLAQTQQQAEELQTQQEELRVTNEELEEQSTALRESQARLELQQAELEQTNSHLEQQTEMLSRQKDELESAQRILAERGVELERASRYKSEFLANMSHELRTPLNSSLILSKLLADNKDGNLTPEQASFAQNIYSAGNDLLDLINDILDLSKIESGKMEVKPESVRIARLAQTLSQTFEPIAQEKHIGFSVVQEESAPQTIETDPQRLMQILKNLLSNAVKFTERGSVRLMIAGAPGDSIRFDVRDTGIGIPAIQQEVIFEAFRQADGTTSRKFGGTGLGLAISRDLAGLLGGRIDLSSEPGHGSTFSLIIPQVVAAATTTPAHAAVPPAPAPQTAPSPPLPAVSTPSRQHRPRPAAMEDDRGHLEMGARVLLVIEDDAAFGRVLYGLAHELGFQCLLAPTADEGIQLALRHRPAAIVLDMNLPDHSGLTVLDRLKRNPATRHIPVQVASVDDHTQAALEMGAAGYMLKPVQRERLADALASLHIRFSERVRSVLVVEDDPVQRESICHLLAAHDVRTVPVPSAAAALEQLRTSTLDCMVLDISLPDATGFELLERMAEEDQYSFPPVIVYTARSLSAEEEQQLRRYSRSIIIKGARSPERLLDEVTLFLHQVEANLPADRQKMLQEARSRDAVFEGRTVLIVEDDVRNIFALTSVLEPRGARVVIARNGREALDTVTSRRDIDMVLMDIMMPEMDGYEAMREIRKRPDLRSVPIIALTAKAMRDDREHCLAAGASDYIAKPIDVEQLMSLMRVWMPRQARA
jgi:CheY-like chemotaxis protein/signal transduction histidine kinase